MPKKGRVAAPGLVLVAPGRGLRGEEGQQLCAGA